MEKRHSQKLDKTISLLGFGCMRFPQNENVIDRAQVRLMLDTALGAGVNYFDTAYMYHDGQSEKLLGELLVDRYPRNSFYLADKLPGWKLTPRGGLAEMETIFHEQQQRLHTDYIDFYLVHSLNLASWKKLLDKDILVFLDGLRLSRRVGHIGFSFHGEADTLAEIIKDYNWDFVQLQLNYYDWQEQNGKLQYQTAVKYGLPVVVMEPLRGGVLATLPEKAQEELDLLGEHKSAVSWALRWVGSLANVLTVLSGMSNNRQLTENIKVFSPLSKLRETEYLLLNRVLDTLGDTPPTPCTSCKYCLSECPQKLDIPDIITAANTYRRFGNRQVLDNFLRICDKDKTPNTCLGCNACQKVCPQHIDIAGIMKELAKALD